MGNPKLDIPTKDGREPDAYCPVCTEPEFDGKLYCNECGAYLYPDEEDFFDEANLFAEDEDVD